MDCAQLQRFLKLNDFTMKDDPGRVDLVVLFTCGLTEEDEQLSLEVLKELKTRKRSNAQLVVWGCLPPIDPRAIAKIHAGPSFARRQVRKLEEMIGAKIRYDDAQCAVNHLFPAVSKYEYKRRYDPLTYMIEDLNRRIWTAHAYTGDVFYILIGRGCLGNCSFCSDLHSCGRLQSKPIESVVAEFKQGLERGFKRFFLVSTDEGAYGRDLGYSLSDLLSQLTSENGDYQLLLPQVEPHFLKEMTNDLRGPIRTGKIGLLGVSAQSGSNRILEAMGREYMVEELKESITAARKESAKILISTQLMVGFPGETEDDFMATMSLLDEMAFDYIQVFRFSRRPTTRASFFANQVPETVSVSRHRRLLVKAIYKQLSRKIETEPREISSVQGEESRTPSKIRGRFATNSNTPIET
jgi:threonylcarbamoyladenosine tRNA methylthiotransferase CDKAL1